MRSQRELVRPDAGTKSLFIEVRRDENAMGDRVSELTLLKK